MQVLPLLRRQDTLLEQLPLALQFLGERLVYRALARLVGVVPEAVVAVAVVFPAGVVQDRVQTDALDRHSGPQRLLDLLADIPQPGRPEFVLDPGLSDEERAPVPFVRLTQHL